MEITYDLTILGGGIAGLAAAYYAKRRGLSCEVYEAAERPGGNCITFSHGDFRFDSGAHRMHDKNPAVTRDLEGLLGDNLQRIGVPSQIFDNGRLIHFPFGLHQVLRHLGVLLSIRAAGEFLTGRMGKRPVNSFADVAIRRYGTTVARRFLLNYTEKLWGMPCERLSPVLTGGRLRGLDMRQIVRDMAWRPNERRDMEGNFFYPTEGIGMVADALCSYLGAKSIRTNARVTRILHDGHQIRDIEINGEQLIPVSQVVTTLPIDELVAILDPRPPRSIVSLSRQLTYRSIILVAFFLKKQSVTTAATVYFPDSRFPFTRVVEPRNRSAKMSPFGHTSLVAELPCNPNDGWWSGKDEALVHSVERHLHRIGWLRPEEVVGTAVERLSNAYPVITVESEEPLRMIREYVASFTNLVLHGRTGTFQYKWIHDLFHEARLVVGDLQSTT